MTKMKNSLIIALFGAVILLSGCSKFEDMNKDPNNPSQIKAELLLSNIIYSAFAEDNDVFNQTGQYSTFLGADMGSCWAQHIGKVQYNDEERYIPRVTVVRDFWNTMYEDVCNDANTMYNLADKEGKNNLKGIALVLKAYGFHVLTDCYGDIPFSEAISGASSNNFTPKYDSQEDVYKGILKLLTDADALLASDNGEVSAAADAMYGGDIEKWRKFANSLKFRCLMRISSKDASTDIDVKAELQSILTAGNIFTSNDDEAKFNFASSQPGANPVYETIVYGNRPEFRVGAPMIDILKSLNDPRLPVYAQKNDDNEYVGKPAGYLNLPFEPYTVAKTSALGSVFLQPEAPAYFMSNAELQLLIAEAILKGYVSGNAQTRYTNGLSASFESYGLEDSLASYSDKNLSGNITSDIAKVAKQNWIALFGQGVEAWNEWKRTKQPELTPAVSGAVSEIPSRYTYPNTEQTINASSYQAAIAAQGADVLTTKIWWLK